MATKDRTLVAIVLWIKVLLESPPTLIIQSNAVYFSPQHRKRVHQLGEPSCVYSVAPYWRVAMDRGTLLSGPEASLLQP
jgi:hypothetical protein